MCYFEINKIDKSISRFSKGIEPWGRINFFQQKIKWNINMI